MSMYIDIKFLQTISYRLENFKKKSSNIWNCRCPLCGDSARKNKARGYFFSSSGKNYLQYKCHNCAVSRRFDKFLKEFDPNQYGNYILEKYADNNNNIDKKNVESTLDFIPTFVEPKTEERLIDSIMDRLDNLPDTHEAIQYVRSRKIPAGAFRRLYFVGDIRDIGQLNAKYKASITSSESRLGIPFYNRDGKLTSISLRGMRGESLRYISVKIDEDAPTVFGMDQVDLNKDVLVVEGPLDSLFLPNCIACAGTAFNKIAEMNIPKEKVTIIFDNQPKNKEVCNLVHKYIEQGYKVVLWPDSVPGKDINEMIQHDLSSEDILEIIKSNTFSGLQARAKYAMWRKI